MLQIIKTQLILKANPFNFSKQFDILKSFSLCCHQIVGRSVYDVALRAPFYQPVHYSNKSLKCINLSLFIPSLTKCIIT